MDLKLVGAGLVVIGAGLGIGKIGAAALEGMARQPEQAGKLQTAMLIATLLVSILVQIRFVKNVFYQSVLSTVVI